MACAAHRPLALVLNGNAWVLLAGRSTGNMARRQLVCTLLLRLTSPAAYMSSEHELTSTCRLLQVHAGMAAQPPQVEVSDKSRSSGGGVNLRDISSTDQSRVKPGLAYRSSERFKCVSWALQSRPLT